MSIIYVGIDIAKEKFDVAILINEEIKTSVYKNNIQGFKKLLSSIKNIKNENIHACMESTGAYSKKLAYFFIDHNIKVSVVNPVQIKGFAKSAMLRNKTGKTDAMLIAKFCKLMHPDLWQPSKKYICELQAMVRHFDDLQGIYYQEQNRLEYYSDTLVRPSITKILKQIKKELDVIEFKIKQHIQANEELKNKHILLQSIPGIADRTAARILAFCSEVEKFSNAKQLATYAGLNPSHRQSGKTVNGKPRLSKMGNAEIRKAIYMPTLVAMKHNPIIKAFCEQLKENGKPKMVIVCAAMRKLIHLIYGILKSGVPFALNKINTITA